jgi:aminoglycoside phosphotransferase (APT) family kinase protein
VKPLAPALAAARLFCLDGVPRAVAPLGEGLINRTYRVATDRGQAYVLQQLNPHLFADPGPVMANIARVTRQLAAASERPALLLVETPGGACWTRDGSGAAWRCYRFVSEARSWSRPPDARTAACGAAAFGRFCADLADLPASELQAVLPGFHDTPARLAALEAACARDACGRAAGVRRQLDAIRARAPLAALLQDAQRRGELVERVVHNDTKFNNLLFHRRTGEALCVVDLDTVMPGLLVHDFGDLVRSAAARGGEGDLTLDLGLAEALVEGYLAGAGPVFDVADREFLAVAPQVLALELAARFLTDYLDGDQYFRTTAPDQNLRRCQGQLALLGSMEGQEKALRRLIARHP